MKNFVKKFSNLTTSTIFTVKNKTNNYIKKLVKDFNNLNKSTIFTVKNKTNNYIKKLVKDFNNLNKSTIFTVKNKTNNNLKISSFNKSLITFITLLFFYLFYLSIPALYDKGWVQNNIENLLQKEFKINFSSSSDISYHILPTPHFLLKDSKIFKLGDKKIGLASDIKALRVFIKQGNYFNKDKIKIKKVKLDNANISLLKSDFKILNEFSNNRFSSKKIKINNSNIFFRNNFGETISIIKIDEALLFFDEKQLLNLFNLSAETFNVPFVFNLKNEINSLKNKKINVIAKKLKLNIFNESKKINNNITGKSILSFLGYTIDVNYKFEDNVVTFDSSNSKIINSKINYSGKLLIDPFDLHLNINLGNFKISKISKLLRGNSILSDLVKTELFFNENINISTSISAFTDSRAEIFQEANINFNIINGKINFNKTRFTNKKIGTLEIQNSNLFFENKKLILNADIIMDIKNRDKLFSFLQTNKKSRTLIKNVLINVDYEFLTNQIKFNNIKIDNENLNDEFLEIIESLNDNNINNLNKSKRLINEFFDIYAG